MQNAAEDEVTGHHRACLDIPLGGSTSCPSGGLGFLLEGDWAWGVAHLVLGAIYMAKGVSEVVARQRAT